VASTQNYEYGGKLWPNITRPIEETIAEVDYEKSFFVDVDCDKKDSRHLTFGVDAVVSSARNETEPGSPKYWDCEPVKFHWRMKCGRGDEKPKKGLSIGMHRGTSELVQDGEVRKKFKKANYVVGPEVESTTLYIYMHDSYQGSGTDSEVYISPFGVYANLDHVYPYITGQIVSGGWISDEIKSVTIEYNCKVSGGKKILIELDFDIPYYTNAHV
jgi:hypothetical protein